MHDTTGVIDEPPPLPSDPEFEQRVLHTPPEHDVDRVLPPDEEHDRRRRRLARLGVLLVVGFSMPIVGGPGAAVAFPQFTAFPGWNLAGFLTLLPLLAGVLVVVASRWCPPPWRGAALLLAGLSPILALSTVDGAAALFAESATRLPSPLLLMVVLWIAAGTLLLIPNRVRRYRPMSRSSYWLGVAALPCLLAHLLLPVEGFVPLFSAFELVVERPVLGVGWTAHVLLMLAACAVTLRNTPGQPPRNASRRGTAACWLLVFSLLVLALSCVASAMLEFGRAIAAGASAGHVLPIATAVVKAAATFAGFLLLIPCSIADLWIGRS